MDEAGERRANAARHDETGAADRVAAGLVHEFRNILNPIVSAAWLLEANANDPEKVVELAHRIDGFARAEGRIAAKVRELLRIEAAAGPAQPTPRDDPRTAPSTSAP